MEQLSQSLCSVILVLAFSFVPYVDWAAHLGGVICGFASGMVCFSAWIKTKTYAAFWFVVGVALNLVFYIVTLTYFLTYVEPRNDLMDVCEYYKQFFENYECNCQIDN
jgi:energy-coupling factor transporter transmembrane protein EcfT